MENLVLEYNPTLYIYGPRGFATLERQSVTPPPRQRATLVSTGSELVLFGGSGSTSPVELLLPQADVFYNDVWVTRLDSAEWRQLSPRDPQPAPRRAHAAVYVRGRMIMFGGRDGRSEAVLSDTWTLDVHAGEWARLPCVFSGPARKGHSLTALGTQVVVFGGRGELDSDPYDADVHVLDTSSEDPSRWTWSRLETVAEQGGPGARNHHAAAATGVADTLVVIGGRACHICGPLGDVWLLSLRTRAWTAPQVAGEPPLPRFEAVAWADGPGRIRLATGEAENGVLLNDVWELSLRGGPNDQWRRLAPLDCPAVPLSQHEDVIAYGVGLFTALGLLWVLRQWWTRRGYEAIN